MKGKKLASKSRQSSPGDTCKVLCFGRQEREETLDTSRNTLEMLQQEATESEGKLTGFLQEEMLETTNVSSSNYFTLLNPSLTYLY
jgi:hypothetical protein